MVAQLRVFPTPPDVAFDQMQEPSINIRLRDLLPILALAKKNNYLWLQDFLEDEITVTPDLYDILRSFRQYRRPSA